MATVLFLIYLAGVGSAVSNLSIIFLVIAMLATLFSAVHCAVEEVPWADYVAGLKKVAPWIIACAALAVFTPSKTLLHVAAGLYVGKEVAETEIGQKAYQVLDGHLDRLLEKVGE